LGVEVTLVDAPDRLILPGRVQRMSGAGLKIPHMGWNQIDLRRRSIGGEYRRLSWRATGLRVIVSGGVRSLDVLRRAKDQPGIEGIIVGRALYIGAIDLRAALVE
jgi:hypothetical protein